MGMQIERSEAFSMKLLIFLLLQTWYGVLPAEVRIKGLAFAARSAFTSLVRFSRAALNRAVRPIRSFAFT